MKPGDRVGAYRILEHLGDGGMAEVWKVQNVALTNKPPAALKLLLSTYARDASIRELFFEEARVQSELKHPNILAVQEFIMDEDHVGIVLDLVDTDLSVHIQETSGPIPWHLAKDLFFPLLDAVEHAHQHEEGIVHRDLKPSNVLLVRDGERLIPKLTDFGIAKQVGKSKTKAGSTMGTLAYMAPEQHRDAKNVDMRADIYALGMTLFEMLTGRVAFQAKSDYDLVHSKLNDAPPAPSSFYAHIPPFVEEAVLKALARPREDRFADCAAFREALQGLGVPEARKTGAVSPPKPAAEGLPAEPERSKERRPRPGGSSRPSPPPVRKPLGGLVTIVAAGFLVLGALWGMSQEPSNPAPVVNTVEEEKPDAGKPRPAPTADRRPRRKREIPKPKKRTVQVREELKRLIAKKIWRDHCLPEKWDKSWASVKVKMQSTTKAIVAWTDIQSSKCVQSKTRLRLAAPCEDCKKGAAYRCVLKANDSGDVIVSRCEEEG